MFHEIIPLLLLITGLGFAVASLIVAMQWTKPIKKNSLPITIIFTALTSTANGLIFVWGDMESLKLIWRPDKPVERTAAGQILQLFHRNDVYFAYVGLVLACCIAAAYVCSLKRASQFAKDPSPLA
jgi:hypothetical protein